jgi:hypothetical protein
VTRTLHLLTRAREAGTRRRPPSGFVQVRLPETGTWRGVDVIPPRLISREGTAILLRGQQGLCWNQVRIDPNSTVAGHPALVIRRTLRLLRGRLSWGLADPEAAVALNPGKGRTLAKAIRAARLIESAGRGAWVTTQAGRTFSSATAAKPITRMTAERALAEFLERARCVDRDPHFPGKVGQGRTFRENVESRDATVERRRCGGRVGTERGKLRSCTSTESATCGTIGQGRPAVSELSGDGTLVASGDVPVSEGPESCDRSGRLRRGEVLHLGGSTPSADRRVGATSGGELGHTDATAAKSASTRITLLMAETLVGQRFAVKTDNSAFSASSPCFSR